MLSSSPDTPLNPLLIEGTPPAGGILKNILFHQGKLQEIDLFLLKSPSIPPLKKGN